MAIDFANSVSIQEAETQEQKKSFGISKLNIAQSIPYSAEEEITFEKNSQERASLRSYTPTWRDKVNKGLEAIAIRPGRIERIGKAEAQVSEANAIVSRGGNFDEALLSILSRDRSDPVGAMKTLGDVVWRTPKALMIGVLKRFSGIGGANVVDGGWITRVLKNADEDSEDFAIEIFKKFNEKRIFPGLPIHIVDVAQLPESIAFSIVSVGEGLAVGGGVALLPVPGARIAAWTSGTVASGAAAFNMAGYEIMQEYLEFKNEEALAKTGVGITAEEQEVIRKDFYSKAVKFGLWEAIPEALSNLAFAKLLTLPLARMRIGGSVAGRITAKLAALYGEELLTESITEKFQTKIRREAGLEEGDPNITLVAALKRVAPQVFLLTTIMAGTGASIIKIRQKVKTALKKEIGEQHPEFKKLSRGTDELVIIPGEGFEGGGKVASTSTEFAPEKGIEKVSKVTPEAIQKRVTEKEAAEVEKVQITPAEKAKAQQIQGRISKLDSDLKQVRQQIDNLDKQRQRLVEAGVPTKALENEIKVLQKREDIIDSELGELLTTQKELITLRKEKIEIKAEVLERKEAQIIKEKLRGIEQGIREGRILTKKEIKSVQSVVIDLFKKAKLDIPVSIKSIQTQEQLTKALPEIQERISKLVEVSEKKSLAKEIQRIAKKKVDVDYREQIDDILEDFDLKIRTPKTKIKRQKRAAFIERQREEGNLDFLPPDFFTDFGKKTLDEMTLGEVEQLRDQISVLSTVGATKNRLLIAKGEKDFQKRLTSILDKAYERAGTKEQVEGVEAPRVSNRRKGFIKKSLNFIDNFFAAHRKIEFILKSLNNQEVFEIIQSGINKELTLTEETYTKLKETFKLISKDFKNITSKLIKLEGVPVELTKEQMIGVVLNNGNFGNRQRLINGNKFTLEQIQIIENSLTKNEKEFANQIFEIVDSFFPETVNVTKKLVGVKPKAVEGKYFPIEADRELDKRAKLNAAQRDLFQDIFHITFIERGFTKERVGGKAPINLNVFDVIFKHVDSVIHYNSMAIPVRDTQKIINNERFKKAISDIMNPAVYNQFPTWLKDIANPRGLQTSNIIDTISQTLRHNATAAILGHRLTVSLLQGGSITLTVNEIGVKDTMNGVVQFYKNPRRAIEFVYSKDPEMKNRAQRFDREIKDFIKSNQGQKITQGKKSWSEILFVMIRGVDFVTTMPSWLGAYEQSFNETGNVDRAVEFAAGVVRRTQPAAAMQNLSAIMRGSATQKLFTSFMTHFSNVHNQLVNAMDELKYSQDHALRKSATYARALWWVWIAPALLSGWIRSGFKSEDWRKFAQELVLYPFAGMIFIRDLMTSIVKGFDFGAPPGLSVFKEIQFAFQGKKGRTKLKHGVKAVGLLTGRIPTQWVDTIDGFIDLLNGETEDFRRLIWGESAIEPVKRGIFVPKKKTPILKLRP